MKKITISTNIYSHKINEYYVFKLNKFGKIHEYDVLKFYKGAAIYIIIVDKSAGKLV